MKRSNLRFVDSEEVETRGAEIIGRMRQASGKLVVGLSVEGSVLEREQQTLR